MAAVATLPRLAQSRWLPALVIALALVWMTLSVTRLAWQWLTPEPDSVLLDGSATTTATIDRSLPLAQFRLFGSAVDPAGGAYADAPDTTLNYTLKGTNSHHRQELARAVIADDQQSEKVYKVGDEFPNGVRVQAIYPDRVVLNAAGRIEVLRLRQALASRSTGGSGPANGVRSPVAPGSDGLIGLNGAPPAPPTAPGSVNPMAVVTTPIDWEAVRQQAIADPGSIAKAFSVLPVMIDGKLAGVRVSSNTYGEQLAQAGLKPDDIVTAVNGRRLDSIEAGYAALDSLKAAGAVSLTVTRDGSEKTLPAIRMPQ
jgi:general secretion pathway protein C